MKHLIKTSALLLTGLLSSAAWAQAGVLHQHPNDPNSNDPNNPNSCLWIVYTRGVALFGKAAAEIAFQNRCEQPITVRYMVNNLEDNDSGAEYDRYSGKLLGSKLYETVAGKRTVIKNVKDWHGLYIIRPGQTIKPHPGQQELFRYVDLREDQSISDEKISTMLKRGFPRVYAAACFDPEMRGVEPRAWRGLGHTYNCSTQQEWQNDITGPIHTSPALGASRQ